MDEFSAWSNSFYGPVLGPLVPKAYSGPTWSTPAPLCFDAASRGESTSLHWQAAMRSAGDGAILCRSREMLAAAGSLGNPVYWYFFTATPIWSANWPAGSMPFVGAFHGAEVPFVFGDAFELGSDGERDLSEALGCYWSNFAVSGDPNHGLSGCSARLKLPRWPVLGATGAEHEGTAIVFSNTSVTIEPGLRAHQCDLFRRFH
jgi:para-nitrobenzyl esterase